MKKELLILFLSTIVMSSYAQPGTPDLTFGSAAVVTMGFGPIQAGCNDMAIQPDGKIVMAGFTNNGTLVTFAVTRHNTNGTPDNSFDGDGKLTTVFPGSLINYATAIAIQADGKIVVAGYCNVSSTGNCFGLARYNTNGSLDNSFSGDGMVTTAIGPGGSMAFAIAIQADGKIVLAGNSFNGSNTDFAVARYNPDGSPDNSFDGDGQLTTAVSLSYDDAFSIILQPDGKIVVAGNCGIPSSSDFALVRYNGIDGSLDNSFNGTGKVITTVNDASDETGLAIQADGKILMGGSDGINFTLARYNQNGSLDNSFDTDGIVSTTIGSQSEATTVVLQPDGKIIAGGHALTGAGWDFALARYNTNGSLDNSFDGDGIVTKNVNGNDYGQAIKLSGGRVYLGGVSNQVVFTLLAFQTGIITLPVQLTGFSAFIIDNSTQLKWQTASEYITSHFDIEYSNNGNTFSVIGQVQASGNSQDLKNYSFSHRQPAAGINYYRLRILDIDGHFTYSKVVVVSKNSSISMEISPNPAQDLLLIRITASNIGNTLFQIHNTEGRIIKQQNKISAGSSLTTAIDISSLSTGIYFLVATNESGTTIKKFIKQ